MHYNSEANTINSILSDINLKKPLPLFVNTWYAYMYIRIINNPHTRCTHTSHTPRTYLHVPHHLGCQLIAPSDMMDNRVGAIKNILDQHGYGEKVEATHPVTPPTTLYLDRLL